ncbi:MAG: hypothetical protein PHW74_10320 [Desulfobacca sp.]|nr:hypothetical protein [Desulfobacca sp.]
MDQKQMFKQMLDFNKSAFDNTFNAMVMLQEQTERMVNQFLEKAVWLPQEGKKAVDEWVKSYRKGCEDYKKLVDDSFKKVEAFFTAK